MPPTQGKSPSASTAGVLWEVESVLDVTLPCSATPNIPVPKFYLLAVVWPCSTGGKDATCKLMTYINTTVPVVIDIRTVECIVGRVGSSGGLLTAAVATLPGQSLLKRVTTMTRLEVQWSVYCNFPTLGKNR